MAGHDATEVKIEELPFFEALQIVEKNTGLQRAELLKRLCGFKASPAHCTCGRERNVYEFIIQTVNSGPHGWDFMKEALRGDTKSFFYQCVDWECRCGIKSKDVGVLYDYTGFSRWPP